MCGYCIESWIILNFIEREQTRRQVKLENNWVPFYLQESKDFVGIMIKTRKFGNFPGSIDIAFCRTWEILLNKKYDGVYQSMEDQFGTESINEFLFKMRNNRDCASWNSIGNGNLYVDKSCWNKFVRNKKQLIEKSEETLILYHNWWIQGNNKETSDPQKRFQETGIMDPIDDTTPKDWDKFYLLFPSVFFSLLFLLKHQSNSDIIKRIAIEYPHDVPDFFGYDLWLQRKAFITCLKEYGVRFILEHYDDIRLELIYYALLKESIFKTELNLLKEHLLSHPHGDTVIDSDSVLQLIGNQNHK